MNKWLLNFFLAGFLVSCSDNEPSFIPESSIPTDALPHVNSFFAAARGNGLQLDSANLVIRYEDGTLNDTQGNPVCGTAEGAITDDRQNLVIIDRECLAWTFNEQSREILIYHELGHVFLERLHDSDLLPNGDYKSIMTGERWNVRRFYTEDLTKRSYYLEELFDPGTPVPSWAK